MERARRPGRKPYHTLVGLIAILLVGCAPVAASTLPRADSAALSPGAGRLAGELTVFAAASLAEPFAEIGARLERANSGARITFHFAGSSTLRAQLAQGASADLFASADDLNMRRAQSDGSVVGEARRFARNRLVVIAPSREGTGPVGLADLARPGVKLVLGQRDLPIGSYARQSLARLSRTLGADFADRVLANVVSEEANVKQIVAKVRLGEADAGIVYSSDVTPAVRPHVRVIPIPASANVVADYPIAVTRAAANEAGARAFVDYLLSTEGQAVLESHGFVPVAMPDSEPSGEPGPMLPDALGAIAGGVRHQAGQRRRRRGAGCGRVARAAGAGGESR